MGITTQWNYFQSTHFCKIYCTITFMLPSFLSLLMRVSSFEITNLHWAGCWVPYNHLMSLARICKYLLDYCNILWSVIATVRTRQKLDRQLQDFPTYNIHFNMLCSRTPLTRKRLSGQPPQFPTCNYILIFCVYEPEKKQISFFQFTQCTHVRQTLLKGFSNHQARCFCDRIAKKIILIADTKTPFSVV